MDVNDPTKIAIREKALAVIDGFMRKDESVKIKYAAKYASIQNAYKKWQGEVMGLRSTGALLKKRTYETDFQKRVDANPAWRADYGTLLSDLTGAYAEIRELGQNRDFYIETIARIEAFAVASTLSQLASTIEKSGPEGLERALPGVRERLKDIYKEYDPRVDQALFEVLLHHFATGQDTKKISPLLQQKATDAGGYKALAEQTYTGSILDDGEAVLQALEKDPSGFLQTVRSDPFNLLLNSLSSTYNNAVTAKLAPTQNQINRLQRTYMKAQLDVFPEKTFYPDANSTLRVTYGNVKGYQPRDAVGYGPYTYLDGVIEKFKPGDYEFDLPEKLRQLYKARDYGVYGVAGKMPVCFIAMNHTTGGNSGSPALDAWGNLVGLNFDRVWEGTMSDINYDPSICRNIMVDIRYVLFIIDKFAGASHLVGEMNLVHSKKKP